MSEQGARELLAAEYEASGLVTAANFIRASATDDLKCLNVNDRYAIRAITAAKEQGRREAIAEVVEWIYREREHLAYTSAERLIFTLTARTIERGDHTAPSKPQEPFSAGGGGQA